LTSGDAKFEAVETCTPYDAAPETAFHVKLGVVDTPVAESTGDATLGVPTIVVNVDVVEKALVPPAFAALTLQ
jgi:hypothetical protein